ncbi:MAG TPA: hypothetical protein VLH79_07160 [Chthonomonadales bacterium]|nr:hypothetical protein [Chthonomonadales bacterium]
MSLTIVLPWPPTGLSPNARNHWAKLAKLKKQYREACAWTATTKLPPKEREAVRERHVTLTQGDLYT